MRRCLAIIVIFFGLLGLSACNATWQNPTLGEKVTLKIAVFDENAELQKQIELFNQNNADYFLEVQTYKRSQQNEEDGLARLQREITVGGGPDIIDFGVGYSNSDIVGFYTEDLSAYLQEMGSDDYFENIFELFCYQDGLYAIPISFTFQTFVGTKENLGRRAGWNIQEMLECYQEQSGERILYPGETKKDVLGTILTGSMDNYIDWQSGSCNFSSQEFRDLLAFCNMFPDNLIIPEDYSVKQIYENNEALLLPLRIKTVYDIRSAEYIWGEQDVTYIGFPTEEKNGTVVKPGRTVLAISRNSNHKKEAWRFIEQCLGEQCQSELKSEIPVKQSVFNEKLQNAMKTEYEVGMDGKPVPVVKYQIFFEGEEPVDVYSITEKEATQLRELIERAERLTATDHSLYLILQEEADYYFHGSKSIEKTVEVMQGRAQMYISERIKKR